MWVLSMTVTARSPDESLLAQPLERLPSCRDHHLLPVLCGGQQRALQVPLTVTADMRSCHASIVLRLACTS